MQSRVLGVPSRCVRFRACLLAQSAPSPNVLGRALRWRSADDVTIVSWPFVPASPGESEAPVGWFPLPARPGLGPVRPVTPS